jgi:hypothetical protein
VGGGTTTTVTVPSGTTTTTTTIGGGGGTTTTTVDGGTTTTTVGGGTTTTTIGGGTTTTTVPATTTTTTVPATTTTTTVPATTTTTTVPTSSGSLVFTTQPANTEVKSIMGSVVIELRDTNNVLLSSATDSVSLTISSGTLYGTTTKSAVNGVVTFSDLQVRATGSYTITASATGFTGATSSSFSITNPVFGSLSGVALWLKADSVAANNGDSQCTINDWSGNGYDFTQATSAKCPTLATNAKNGKPAFNFDGTQIISTSSTVNTSTFPGVTLFIVFASGSSSSDRVVLEHSANFNSFANSWGFFLNPSWVCNNCSSTIYSSGAYVYSGKNTNDSSLTLNQFAYVSTKMTVGSNDVVLRQNGIITNNTLYSNTVTGLGNYRLYLGGRADESINFTGKVAEVILFNSALSTTDIQTVESGIVSKYGGF